MNTTETEDPALPEVFAAFEEEACALAEDAAGAMDRGDIQKAADLLQEALLLAPQDALLHARLADCQDALGDRGGATQSLLVAAGIDSQNPDILLQLGTLLLEGGDRATAFGCFERGLTLDPEHAGLLRRVANLNLS